METSPLVESTTWLLSRPLFTNLIYKLLYLLNVLRLYLWVVPRVQELGYKSMNLLNFDTILFFWQWQIFCFIPQRVHYTWCFFWRNMLDPKGLLLKRWSVSKTRGVINHQKIWSASPAVAPLPLCFGISVSEYQLGISPTSLHATHQVLGTAASNIHHSHAVTRTVAHHTLKIGGCGNWRKRSNVSFNFQRNGPKKFTNKMELNLPRQMELIMQEHGNLMLN